MPRDLFPVFRIRPFFGMEGGHGKGIVDMALGQVEFLPLPFCSHSIGDGHLDPGGGFFNLVQHDPPYRCHIRCIL